jgi:hypothetical protein
MHPKAVHSFCDREVAGFARLNSSMAQPDLTVLTRGIRM